MILFENAYRYVKCCFSKRLLAVSCTLGEENITSFCSVEQVVNCTEGLDTLGKEIAPLYNINELDLLCR